MNFRRILVPALLAAHLAGGVAAQESVDGASQAQKRIDGMRERLDLSEQQMEQLRPVFEQGAKRRQEVLASFGVDTTDTQAGLAKLSGEDKRKLRNEMRVLGNQTKKQLEGILSEEQLELFRELVAEQRTALRQRAKEQRK